MSHCDSSFVKLCCSIDRQAPLAAQKKPANSEMNTASLWTLNARSLASAQTLQRPMPRLPKRSGCRFHYWLIRATFWGKALGSRMTCLACWKAARYNLCCLASKYQHRSWPGLMQFIQMHALLRVCLSNCSVQGNVKQSDGHVSQKHALHHQCYFCDWN